MNILIGICSCHKNTKSNYNQDMQKELRETIRNTWLRKRPENVQYKFFVGGNDNKNHEDDVIYLECEDDYNHLTHKLYEFYKYVNNSLKFDYLFKCDDSTYLYPEKIEKLIMEHPDGDFFGYDRQQFYPLVLGHCHGGNGYILSKKSVNILIDETKPNISSAEDVWVTKKLKTYNIQPILTSELGGQGINGISYELLPRRMPVGEIKKIYAESCQFTGDI